MIRKLFLAMALVGVFFVSNSSHSEGLCETEPANPCDVVCDPEGGGPDVCDCPCWTDQRVKQSTCSNWNSVTGCWYW